jgi:hypothetical protein
VHDPTLVRVLEAIGDPRRDRDRLVLGQRPARDPLLERLSRHQLHRQEAHAGRLVKAEDRRDVRVQELGQDLRFTLEARETLDVTRERRGEDLDGDVASQRGVGRPVDLAHAAFPELRGDLVRAEALAGGQGHGAEL